MTSTPRWMKTLTVLGLVLALIGLAATVSFHLRSARAEADTAEAQQSAQSVSSQIASTQAQTQEVGAEIETRQQAAAAEEAASWCTRITRDHLDDIEAARADYLGFDPRVASAVSDTCPDELTVALQYQEVLLALRSETGVVVSDCAYTSAQVVRVNGTLTDASAGSGEASTDQRDVFFTVVTSSGGTQSGSAQVTVPVVSAGGTVDWSVDVSTNSSGAGQCSVIRSSITWWPTGM